MLPYIFLNLSSLHTVCRWHPSPSASAAAQMLHVENSHNIKQRGRQVPSCRCNELVTFSHSELFSLGLRVASWKGSNNTIPPPRRVSHKKKKIVRGTKLSPGLCTVRRIQCGRDVIRSSDGIFDIGHVPREPSFDHEGGFPGPCTVGNPRNS
ncbi:hypothetical protein K470DRAFT_9448 [Piedraia hortae CBS 480.64]|uniref:Uncharacterized protein n=1 Tax=Piedraia hortae CBS 480.64 TaxID=1314780 RepID=A0A6A7C4S5_9PEZI|nr:hypothetical protein K470DRAFT_9448 [Piedraia hortae CBS 480.64]